MAGRTEVADVAATRSGTGGSSWQLTRAANAVSWILWLVAVGIDILGAVLTLDAMGRPGAFEESPGPAYASIVVVVAYSTVGLLLRLRRPDHFMGWIFQAFGLIAGVSNICWGVMVWGIAYGADALGSWAAWLGAVAVVPTWTWIVLAVVLCFPEGRPATKHEATLLRAAAAVAVVMAPTIAVSPGPLVGFLAYSNPIGIDGLPGVVARVGLAACLVVVAALVAAALLAMYRRYRSAESIVRHQIRWFAFGAFLVAPIGILYLLLGVGFVASTPAAVRDLLYVLFTMSQVALPVAVLIAVTRYRLYEIDRLISRALVYGALTATLAGLYAASIRLFNALFVTMTGQGSEAALIVSTLILATTFTPIKGYLERIVARRFPTTTKAARSHEDPHSSATASLDDREAQLEAIVRRVVKEELAGRAASAAGVDDHEQPSRRSAR